MSAVQERKQSGINSATTEERSVFDSASECEVRACVEPEFRAILRSGQIHVCVEDRGPVSINRSVRLVPTPLGLQSVGPAGGRVARPTGGPAIKNPQRETLVPAVRRPHLPMDDPISGSPNHRARERTSHRSTKSAQPHTPKPVHVRLVQSQTPFGSLDPVRLVSEGEVRGRGPLAVEVERGERQRGEERKRANARAGRRFLMVMTQSSLQR
jgi:hypothetical protein